MDVQYMQYKHAHFTGLIFVVRESTMKSPKIGLLKKFLLYGNKKALTDESLAKTQYKKQVDNFRIQFLTLWL